MAAGPIGAVDPDDPSRIVPINEYPAMVEKFMAKRDWRRAQEFIDKGLAINPLSVQLRFQRCVLLEARGDKEGARKELEGFIGRYPEIPEPYNNLAAIYSSMGNLDRAEELLKRSLALRPNFALAHTNLGNLYLARARNSFLNAQQYGARTPAVQAKIESLDRLLK